MTPELREKILAYNRQATERKMKAEDLEALMDKLKPVLALIWRLFPEEVKAILKKYGITEE